MKTKKIATKESEAFRDDHLPNRAYRFEDEKRQRAQLAVWQREIEVMTAQLLAEKAALESMNTACPAYRIAALTSRDRLPEEPPISDMRMNGLDRHRAGLKGVNE